MAKAYLNQVSTAVPDYDVHQRFVDYAPSLLGAARDKALFKRMASKAQIEHRYSFLPPHSNSMQLDGEGFYRPGHFPDTAARMAFYKRYALKLAKNAIAGLDIDRFRDDITHLIVTTCTGFYAPGLDLEIVEHFQLNASVERTVVGFMGCYAGINALKLARHIVRSDERAKVLILNLELCTLHLQDEDKLEQVLSFLIFADGCAASIVSADPIGLELESFASTIVPETTAQITWHIGNSGFDMVLSGDVPPTILKSLPERLGDILHGNIPDSIQHWAIHPGGRSILDAVQNSIGLTDAQLSQSRSILRRYGNMSSASIMFVLKEMIQPGIKPGQGCGMAFGPGLTIESMLFRTTAG